MGTKVSVQTSELGSNGKYGFLRRQRLARKTGSEGDIQEDIMRLRATEGQNVVKASLPPSKVGQLLPLARHISHIYTHTDTHGGGERKHNLFATPLFSAVKPDPRPPALLPPRFPCPSGQCPEAFALKPGRVKQGLLISAAAVPEYCLEGTCLVGRRATPRLPGRALSWGRCSRQELLLMEWARRPDSPSFYLQRGNWQTHPSVWTE